MVVVSNFSDRGPAAHVQRRVRRPKATQPAAGRPARGKKRICRGRFTPDRGDEIGTSPRALGLALVFVCRSVSIRGKPAAIVDLIRGDLRCSHMLVAFAHGAVFSFRNSTSSQQYQLEPDFCSDNLLECFLPGSLLFGCGSGHQPLGFAV